VSQKKIFVNKDCYLPLFSSFKLTLSIISFSDLTSSWRTWWSSSESSSTAADLSRLFC